MIEAVHDTFDPSIGVQLLADIRDIFAALNTDRVTSVALIAQLILDGEKPWATLNRGKQISENTLARLLKPYFIRPRTIRTTGDNTAKGYQLAWFEDAFERYLSPPAAKPLSSTVTPSQVSGLNDLGQKPPVTLGLFVTVENEPNSFKTNTCDGVTVADCGSDHRCDHCGQLGACRPWDWPGRPDGIWLHPRCEAAWYDSQSDQSGNENESFHQTGITADDRISR